MQALTQSTVTQYIQEHIQADAPCSLSHVTSWAKVQGLGGSKMVKAIQELKNARIITIDDESIVELV
jgi:hypothetical protein